MVRYKITGFCDVKVKPAGMAGVVQFKPEHQYITDTLPGTEELLRYAEQHGYQIGSIRDSGMGIIHGTRDIKPVYIYVETDQPTIGIMSPPGRPQP